VHALQTWWHASPLRRTLLHNSHSLANLLTHCTRATDPAPWQHAPAMSHHPPPAGPSGGILVPPMVLSGGPPLPPPASTPGAGPAVHVSGGPPQPPPQWSSAPVHHAPEQQQHQHQHHHEQQQRGYDDREEWSNQAQRNPPPGRPAQYGHPQPMHNEYHAPPQHHAPMHGDHHDASRDRLLRHVEKNADVWRQAGGAHTQVAGVSFLTCASAHCPCTHTNTLTLTLAQVRIFSSKACLLYNALLTHSLTLLTHSPTPSLIRPTCSTLSGATSEQDYGSRGHCGF
jgi:hypothetical protein